LGVIGMGAMGRAMVEQLQPAIATARIELVSVLQRTLPSTDALPQALDGAIVTSDPAQFWSLEPQLVVECAGHRAVQEHGVAALRRGLDLLVISIGALADADLEARLREAAESTGARLLLPAGAVGGIDLLASARLAGLDHVRYTSRKPPSAWRGTPAERQVRLDALGEATVFFEGTARAAAQQYPQNANVAAAIALAGTGFEATEVILTADPAATGNEHLIEADGAFGRASVRVASKPLPGNPKTSWLAALSLARAVLNEAARVVI
jgi:aspartate dehydrogenase